MAGTIINTVAGKSGFRTTTDPGFNTVSVTHLSVSDGLTVSLSNTPNGGTVFCTLVLTGKSTNDKPPLPVVRAVNQVATLDNKGNGQVQFPLHSDDETGNSNVQTHMIICYDHTNASNDYVAVQISPDLGSVKSKLPQENPFVSIATLNVTSNALAATGTVLNAGNTVSCSVTPVGGKTALAQTTISLPANATGWVVAWEQLPFMPGQKYIFEASAPGEGAATASFTAPSA
jgi:hypothetical protein